MYELNEWIECVEPFEFEENIDNEKTTSKDKNTTFTWPSLSSSTTTPQNSNSNFEMIYAEIRNKLGLISGVTDRILDGHGLDEVMDTNLKSYNKEIGDIDEELVINVTLSDAADISLASELQIHLNNTLEKIQQTLNFLGDEKTTVTHSTTSTMTTTANFTNDTIAVNALNAINDTFGLMIAKINEDLHPQATGIC